MKKYILFAIMVSCWAKAQNINKIEYFVDADPGYGAGTDVPITASTPVSANFNVPLGSVSDGFHFLSVRARDINNAWSVVGARPFYKEAISTATLPNIVALEYFIDADPGYGAATAVAVTAGSPLTQNFTASLSAVADGFHFISLRAKDANNKWSVVAIRPFYKESISTAAVPNNVAMEYFVDADPGFGAATALTVTAGTPLTQNFTASLSAVSDGFHFISLRAKDANNKWSVVAIRPFYKESISTATVPNIVAMEYFVDADPGYGAATAVAVTAGSPLTQNITANLGTLANGTHKLSIRAKDANNKWSIVGIKDFIVRDHVVTSAPNLAGFCRVTAFMVPFAISGTYTVGNVFTLQLSNASGSFTSGTTNIGTLTGTAAGTITANIPNTVAVGANYKLRITSSLPAYTDNPDIPFQVLSVCPPPCSAALSLASTTDDVSTGTVLKEANATTGSINATNKLTGTANVSYKARAVILEPGFKADTGVLFKAETGGCN